MAYRGNIDKDAIREGVARIRAVYGEISFREMQALTEKKRFAGKSCRVSAGQINRLFAAQTPLGEENTIRFAVTFGEDPAHWLRISGYDIAAALLEERRGNSSLTRRDDLDMILEELPEPLRAGARMEVLSIAKVVTCSRAQMAHCGA